MSDGIGLLRRLWPGGSKKASEVTEMRHPSGAWGMFGALRGEKRKSYEKEVGDGFRSSVIFAPLAWMMRTFPEAPPIVERFTDQQAWKEDPAHPLKKLLRRPNPFYSGRTLEMVTVLDLAWGNAYWYKVRNAAGEVIELWWLPRFLVTPRWNQDGMTFISHYDYAPGGVTQPLDPRDVVHFRFGLDPNNVRLGLSPFGALMREIGIDDQAADFAGTILDNLGIIGVVVSPKVSGTGTAGKTAVTEVKEYIKKNFTGDHRGDALALGAPTDVNLLQYNLQGFDVSPLRDVSEERVCAVLGLPSAVVGFGSGMSQAKVGATMKELRQLAWTGCLMPLQDIVADEVDRSLLPEFGASDDEQVIRVRFDNTHVRALWEDQAEKDDRVRKNYLASIIRRSEARAALGLPYDTGDDVFVQPVNVVQLGPNGQPVPSTTPAPSNPPPSAGPEDDPNA